MWTFLRSVPVAIGISFFVFQIISAAVAVTWAIMNRDAWNYVLFLFGMGFVTNAVLYAWQGNTAWRNRPRDEDEWGPLLGNLLKHVFWLTAFTALIVLVYSVAAGNQINWVGTWTTPARIYLSSFIFCATGLVMGALLGYSAHRVYRRSGQED
ncbi:MAG TPA: hypothetical protein VHG08_28220 [Longimicrobium sp.]|nr:hypothetical protein [Longimicrobium sp.]